MKRKYYYAGFVTLMFLGIFLVLTQVGYSDGDDAWFFHYTNSMGFFPYLAWRYETWVGRMTGEALVYLTFHLGLPFWRVVNALMLVLLPVGILRLAGKAGRVPEGRIQSREKRLTWSVRGGFLQWQERMSVMVCETAGQAVTGPEELMALAATAAGYLWMAAATLGYAAIWVNGSVFYTWTFTCGVWALMPAADLVFTGATDGRNYFYAIPCAVIASMSIEQMGAVLLVFEMLAILFCFLRDRRVNLPLLIQTFLILAAFMVLFAAPGNQLRVASEITTWMPEYETLTSGRHLFITAQWLLSSFANENKLFCCGIWVVGSILLLQSERRSPADLAAAGMAAVFAVAALLPFAGITVLSDMGMQITDITARVEQVPAPEDLTGANMAALIWWGMALMFTLFFLWRVPGRKVTLILAYLAGIASEAIMFFSPTMYASGARVYYLTDLLYLFVILALSFGLRERRMRYGVYVGMIVAGLVHFVIQIPAFAGHIG